MKNGIEIMRNIKALVALLDQFHGNEALIGELNYLFARLTGDLYPVSPLTPKIKRLVRTIAESDAMVGQKLFQKTRITYRSRRAEQQRDKICGELKAAIQVGLSKA